MAAAARRVAAPALVQRQRRAARGAAAESRRTPAPVSRLNANVNASATPSRRTSWRRGRLVGPNATSRRTAPQARARPTAPPAIESSSAFGQEIAARCRRGPRPAPGARQPRAAGPRNGPGTGWRRWRTRRAAPGRPTASSVHSVAVTRPTVASISVLADRDQLRVATVWIRAAPGRRPGGSNSAADVRDALPSRKRRDADEGVHDRTPPPASTAKASRRRRQDRETRTTTASRRRLSSARRRASRVGRGCPGPGRTAASTARATTRPPATRRFAFVVGEPSAVRRRDAQHGASDGVVRVTRMRSGLPFPVSVWSSVRWMREAVECPGAIEILVVELRRVGIEERDIPAGHAVSSATSRSSRRTAAGSRRPDTRRRRSRRWRRWRAPASGPWRA